MYKNIFACLLPRLIMLNVNSNKKKTKCDLGHKRIPLKSGIIFLNTTMCQIELRVNSPQCTFVISNSYAMPDESHKQHSECSLILHTHIILKHTILKLFNFYYKLFPTFHIRILHHCRRNLICFFV